MIDINQRLRMYTTELQAPGGRHADKDRSGDKYVCERSTLLIT